MVRKKRKAVIAPRSIQYYGWVPDLPDQRDHMYGALHRMAKKLPSKVDLRQGCAAVEDQGNLGSCTANALVGALEFLLLKDKVAFTDLSRLFVYYNERVILHTVHQDSGAELRTGIKTLAKQGVCGEESWPYKVSKFKTRPTPSCYKEGLRRQITSYQRIQTVDEMRACLASGYPFVFGFTVYESFEGDSVAKSGTLNMPKKNEKMLGGHAVMAVGYDDSKQRFLIRNSWGTDWGMKGYYTMPYAYLDDRNLSDDFWTIRRSEEIQARR